MNIMQRLLSLFRRADTSYQRPLDWLPEEEQQQMQETRERIDRAERDVLILDRRKSRRESFR